jgi:hypothetical protein
MDIPLPFSLVNNNVSKNHLEVMPAYWWLYNMYALARNSWKFQNRDKRVHKVQNIEYEPFAPDTIEEIFKARTLLEIWTAKASLRRNGNPEKSISDYDLAQIGRELLSGNEDIVDSFEVLGENMENAKRKVVILKTYKAYHAYADILQYYSTRNLMAYLNSDKKTTFSVMCKDLKNERQKEWVNLGGQMMQKDDLDKLRIDIGSAKLKTWNDIHERYNELWAKYKIDKQKHAYATLCELYAVKDLTPEDWKSALAKAVNIQKFVCDQVYSSRKKDFDNPFRQTTFRNPEEMKAASGTIEENSFIIQVKKETEDFEKDAEEIKKRTNI